MVEKISEGREAAWNMAVEYLKNLDRQLKFADAYSTIMDFDGWYKALRRLRVGIQHKLSKDEEEKIKKFMDKLNPLIGKYFEAKFSGKVMIKEDAEDLYMSLEEFEVCLRKIMDRYDLLIPKKDDPRTAALRR